MNQRKIKFRVWDISNKSWIKTAIGEYIDGNIISCVNINEYIAWPKDFILQQFTGLVDKNGRDIYEGDLINFTIDGVTHGPDAEYEKNVEVWYSEEDAQFVFGKFKCSWPMGSIYWYSMADRVSDIEVVGNIFENNYAKSN
jgi:uncharacterized phage protein (TIGR01671 family)